MMTWAYGAIAAVGVLLTLWATAVNPIGAMSPPAPRPPHVALVTRGPYRWLRHPMYVGQWLMVVGCAGLAAGIWNAVAIGIVAELVFLDWCAREDPRRKVL